MTRRTAMTLLAGSMAHAATRLPVNKNVRWALGSNLWNSFPQVPFTDILDIMRDTGFIGVAEFKYIGELIVEVLDALSAKGVEADEAAEAAVRQKVKALLAHPALSREIDLAALDDYLAFEYVPTPRSIFAAVRRHAISSSPLT